VTPGGLHCGEFDVGFGGAAGRGFIVTSVLAEFPVQLLFEGVTVTFKVNDDPVPAVYVTLLVVAPDVMVPPEMVQAYVALVTAATDAVFPVEEAQTGDVAVITGAYV
jgi:hypothetical protein